jgi:hypothetical protein
MTFDRAIMNDHRIQIVKGELSPFYTQTPGCIIKVMFSGSWVMTLSVVDIILYNILFSEYVHVCIDVRVVQVFSCLPVACPPPETKQTETSLIGWQQLSHALHHIISGGTFPLDLLFSWRQLTMALEKLAADLDASGTSLRFSVAIHALFQ